MDVLIPSLHEFKNSGNIDWYVTFFSLFWVGAEGGTVNVTENILFTGKFSKVV